MASCIRNIHIEYYQNLLIGFQVTVKNVGDVFFRHSVFERILLGVYGSTLLLPIVVSLSAQVVVAGP